MSQLLCRELSLLAFNQRVMAQAEDPSIPLLERLRYLCIVSSNLDEFFEVRVAWLKQTHRATPERILVDGTTAKETLDKVLAVSKNLIRNQYAILRDQLFPALEAEGIKFYRRREWNDAQRDWIKAYFDRELLPILTPIGLDPSHPFPKLLNKSLNFAIELEGKDAFGRPSGMAIVQAPRILPRIVALPKELTGDKTGFVFLSSILHAHVHPLFLGMTVKGCYQFRLTRDSDLTVDEEELTNLRTAIIGELRDRQYGEGVRLEVADNCPEHVSQFLLRQVNLTEEDLYQVDGPVNLVRLNAVHALVNRPDLKFTPFTPAQPPEFKKNNRSIFAAIKKQDILLHHPYQSFTPVLNFVQQAATDPTVVAIKMTIYRTGSDSELVEALVSAALAGKQVTVVVELMARFDEEANLRWASRLEDAGAHVVYGVFGYKVHAKMALIVRKERNELKRYVHFSTGNYHQSTARAYTDFGLFTCDDEFASDANDLFIQITGLGHASKLNKLFQSPFTLHKMILTSIAAETAAARAGKHAKIIAKMNALIEPQVIAALYEASQAGVQIDLIVRGMCILQPGIEGLSENIRVRSIIGRFLEHSRVYYFYNQGAEDLYIASADWMGRNLLRRIETCVPILDAKVKKRIIKEGLSIFLQDNIKAWQIDEHGDYHKLPVDGEPIDTQLSLLAQYQK